MSDLLICCPVCKSSRIEDVSAKESYGDPFYSHCCVEKLIFEAFMCKDCGILFRDINK